RLVYGLLLYWALTFLIHLFRTTSEKADTCHEYSLIDPATRDHTHFRSWQMTSQPTVHCTSFHTADSLYQYTDMERNSIRPKGREYHRYWGNLYKQLALQNEPLVDFLLDSMLAIGDKELLSPQQLAGLMVAFVQDIPYSYIQTETCDPDETGGKPCLDNIQFGILSPYEFLHTLQGDCDTRAVLLYVLLQKIGLKPMIVISYEYGHAMLALNLPSQGQYIMHGADKYYFWETTATGWGLGMLPPGTSNVDYWEIALVHEL
ncbi:MAG: hypothetical protein OEY56_13425, partial [Cyclobacteriaceae bacterium]|nr:hypothetical protein [Cyclobacteriaceae bacterium]